LQGNPPLPRREQGMLNGNPRVLTGQRTQQ